MPYCLMLNLIAAVALLFSLVFMGEDYYLFFTKHGFLVNIPYLDPRCISIPNDLCPFGSITQ